MGHRWDLTGIFWDDYVEPKVPVIKEKKVPPESFWLDPAYLPNYEEACACVPNFMSDAELQAAVAAKDRLVWDTEFYPNYALVGARSEATGKLVAFERYEGQVGHLYQRDKLEWILRNFTMVGFNDTAFDVPMVMAVLAGFDTVQLMACVNYLINGKEGASAGFGRQRVRPADFYKDMNIQPFAVDNIDLIALTPLGPGLKTCAGRMHTPRMADLPFPVGQCLSGPQVQVLRWYWVNDLFNTHTLYTSHKTAIELREVMTREYAVDVRSKSDPQIAEQVIRKEIMRITRQKYIQRAKIVPWRSFKYVAPSYLKFASPTMQWVLDFVCRQDFLVDDGGSPVMPPELDGLNVNIAGSVYRMGVGGLHSQEKRAVHFSDDVYELKDVDVTSYYPQLIIQQGMFPPNVGPEFLHVFTRIVERRVAAKRAGDKATAETLKIVANGTFGKTGERGGFSVVYYPEMMIQVTVTGQLSLLLLIERLELAGVSVVSANTDGIVTKCPRQLCEKRDAIMAQWEADTGLTLEGKIYKALYSRDVNNYVAVYDKPAKEPPSLYGDPSPFAHAKAIGAYRRTVDVYPLKWNPTCEVCGEALILYLALGTPVADTVRACKDFRKFVQMRTVKGGAVKGQEYLGKAIRWYYSTQVEGDIIVASSGHSVPMTTGARPCMVLPTKLPDDLDYDYYVERTLAMLDDFFPKKNTKDKAAA